MKYTIRRIMVVILAMALTVVSFKGISVPVYAADGTVKIFIGDGTSARHHMAIALGTTSDEYRFELKSGEAKSSSYSSSNTSAFKIVNTGEGKCKVQSVGKEQE